MALPIFSKELWPGTPQQVVRGGVPNVTLQRFKSAFPFKVTTKTEKKGFNPKPPTPNQTCLCLSSLCPASINQKAYLAGHREIKIALSPTSRALRLNKGRTTRHTSASVLFAWNLKTCSLDLLLDGSPTLMHFI